jgi:hypothetical protein
LAEATNVEVGGRGHVVDSKGRLFVPQFAGEWVERFKGLKNEPPTDWWVGEDVEVYERNVGEWRHLNESGWAKTGRISTAVLAVEARNGNQFHDLQSFLRAEVTANAVKARNFSVVLTGRLTTPGKISFAALGERYNVSIIALGKGDVVGVDRLFFPLTSCDSWTPWEALPVAQQYWWDYCGIPDTGEDPPARGAYHQRLPQDGKKASRTVANAENMTTWLEQVTGIPWSVVADFPTCGPRMPLRECGRHIATELGRFAMHMNVEGAGSANYLLSRQGFALLELQAGKREGRVKRSVSWNLANEVLHGKVNRTLDVFRAPELEHKGEEPYWVSESEALTMGEALAARLAERPYAKAVWKRGEALAARLPEPWPYARAKRERRADIPRCLRGSLLMLLLP